jgi:hypothetical protein
MSNLNEEQLSPIEICLNPETIDEAYLRQLGAQIEFLIKAIFGGSFIPARLKGTQTQMRSFARALGNETRYLRSFERHGLSDKRTLNNRHKLENAIAGFEKETGIKWPFK